MNSKLLSCAIVIMTTSTYAAEVSIYKWVDDNGIAHFSHSHPANKIATEVDVQVAYSPDAQAIMDNEGITNDDSAENKEKRRSELAKKNEKMFAENCKAAQANKKILSNFKKILVQDENGEEKLLTGDQITDQLAVNEKHIDIYCEITK